MGKQCSKENNVKKSPRAIMHWMEMVPHLRLPQNCQKQKRGLCFLAVLGGSCKSVLKELRSTLWGTWASNTVLFVSSVQLPVPNNKVAC